MESLEAAANHFATVGMTLTDKARRSLASAIGLAGSVDGCDEAFISIGLRNTNSMLAHLTDRFQLDFARPDEDCEDHTPVPRRRMS